MSIVAALVALAKSKKIPRLNEEMGESFSEEQAEQPEKPETDRK